MAEPLITNRISGKEPAKVVAKATVATSDKKGLAKVLDAIVKTDAKTVMDTVIYKVIIPSTLQTIMKSVNTGLGMFFGIEIPQTIQNSITAPSNMPRIGYSSISTQAAQAAQQTAPLVGYTGLSVYSKLTWDYKHDADSILQSMADYLSEYHTVSVGKLCEFAGIQNVATDYNIGWDDLRSARVVELIDGHWTLSLPNPKTLR